MVAAIRRAKSWWAKHPRLGVGLVSTLTVAVIVVGTLSAAAATQAYIVNAVTASTNWTNATVANLNTDDANTTYASTTTQNAVLQTGMADTPIDLGTINSVTINASVRNRTAGTAGNITVQLGASLGGTPEWSASSITLASNANYSVISYPNVARPGGGSWTWTDIQNLEAATRPTAIDGATYTYRVSYIEVVVDYTPYTTTNVTLADGTADPAAADVVPGQLNVPVDQFSLQRTAGNKPGVVNTVTVTRPNTTTPISAVDIYTDLNGNGAIDAGDASVGTGTFGAGTTATITINQSVGDTAANYLIVYDIGGTATNGQTASATITNATYTMIDGLTESDNVGSTFTVRPVTVTVGNGTDPGTIQTIATNQANVVFDEFTLQRTVGTSNASITSLTVNNSQTTASFVNVQVYRDVNQNGYLDPGTDVPLNATPAAGGAANITVAFDSPETVDGALVYYLIVGSTSGSTGTINASISGAAGTGYSTLTDNDTAQNFTVGGATNTTVTVANGTDPGAANVTAGQADVSVDAFTFRRTAGNRNASIGAITVTNAGTGTPSATVSAVDIYRDTNNSGAFDAGDEKLNTTSGTFTGTTSTVTLAYAEYVYSTARTYFVVYTFSGTAVGGTTANAQISAVTGTNLTFPNSVVYNDTAGNWFTIEGIQVTIGNGTADPAGADTYASKTGLVVDRFRIERTSGSGTATVLTATVHNAGTAPGTAHIWTDANNDGSIVGETDLGSAAFAGGDAVINITDQTVGAVGTPAYYIITVDVGAGATDGQTVIATLSAVTGSVTPTLTFAYQPDTANTFTVRSTIVAVGDGTALSTPVDVYPGDTNIVIDAFTLSRSQGLNTPVVNSITVAKTGTAVVTAPQVRIYLDQGTIGQFDGADGAAIAQGSFDTPIALTANQTIDASKNYIVVVFIDGSATAGTSVTGHVSAIGGTNFDSAAYGDTSSRTANVVWPPTNVTIGNGTADPGPDAVTPGQTGVIVDRFRIERTGGTQAGTVDTIIVTSTGTAPLSNAHIYTDTNNDGSISGETLLGSAGFTGASANVNITPDQAIGLPTSPAYYIVTVDVGAATDAQTVIAAATAATGSGTPVPTFTYSDTANTFTVTITADTQAPTVPANVHAVAGPASPTIATITWDASTDNVAITGYEVWKCDTAGGTYWPIPGGTAGAGTLTFDDTTGVAGQQYFYKVRARDAVPNWSALSVASEGVTATWVPAVAPHAIYSATTLLCKVCHDPHVATIARDILRAGAATTEAELCYTCHDGTSAGNVKTAGNNSFDLASGHEVESLSAGGDLSNNCSSCHTPHRDYMNDAMLPKPVVNGVTLGAEPNALCLACHNATNGWYGAGYPSSASPSIDSTGYPTLGTFPTNGVNSIAYTSDPANAHLTIPETPSATPARASGDCLYCHASHRSSSAYDSLVARFQPSTTTTLADDQANGSYAALCFKCHGSNDYGFTTPASNIKQFVTAGGSRSGHRIKTAGGLYPAGAPLPCYECHNPHGSTRGNKHMFNDALGESLETTTAASPTAQQAAQIRQFCFTCHTTADLGPGTQPYGWDSVATAYAEVSSTAKVAGLERDGDPAANVLRLPDVSGHRYADLQSCYQCHGKSYSAGGNNVHNPSGGVSAGGVSCYNCHSSYQMYMEDNVGAKQGGAERLNVYHHVMGGVASDGDLATTVDSQYPTGTADGMRCLSCHVDHDKFNANQGGNLRANPTTNAPVTASNTDNTLCRTCHAMARTRNAVNEKSAGTAVQAVDFAGYPTSAHQYNVSSSFGASTFQADCSKCHNDEQAKEFQTSTRKFGTHWSAERSILTALGGTVSDPMGETNCYGCHTGTGAGADGYGVQPDHGAGPADMTASARSVRAQFGLASKHPVVAAGGNSVECVNCHNPHEVQTATDATHSRVSDPDDTYTLAPYVTDGDRSAFCLACHDGTLPTYTVGATLVPSTVTIAAPDADKSTNGARGHWSAVGAISAGEVVNCAECHDNHASNVAKLLGVYDATDGKNYIGTTEITANDNTVCYACHTGATGTTYTRKATAPDSGYPDVGTWPGQTVYTGANGIHKGVNVVWTGSGYTGGDCKNCHDVHGTANTYDELRGTFTSSDFSTCFECHDGSPSSRNIKQFFPTTAGGSATQTAGSRFGHKTLSDGSLPAGSALPCYDCHNPHGSGSADGLLVIAATGYSAPNVTYTVIGDDEVLDTTTDAGVRKFCFTCHTTSDTGVGWNGSAYAAVPSGAAFEGISRTTYSATGAHLRLPAATGHASTDADSCYGCHGNEYGTGGSNVHNPTGGASAGGIRCYGCHKPYKETMDADGTSNTSSYHHVMGTDTSGTDYDGDSAFGPLPTTYPISQTDLYCLSCHVDHDKFNANKAANLRASLSSSPNAMNTDFAYSAPLTYYATLLTETAGTWSNGGNSYGASDGSVASSPNPAFDGRHTFTASPPSSIGAATVTVRSRAYGNWGSGTVPAQTGLTAPLQVIETGSSRGSFTYAGTTVPTTMVQALTDGEPDNGTDLLRSPAGTSATPLRAALSDWTIPTGATITNVTVYARTDRYNSTNTMQYQMAMVLNGANPAAYTTMTTGTNWGDQSISSTTAPGGAAWNQTNLNQLEVCINDNNATNQLDVTQVWAVITYNQGPYSYTNNDTWAIQYTTVASPAAADWVNIAAPNTSVEGALTDHTATVSGLTTANWANFKVRVVGAVVGTADNAGTVDWDSTTVTVTPTNIGNGICIGCHSVTQTRDATNQATVGASSSTSPLSINGFGASKHQYTVSSTFSDSTSFGANCSKCHDDEQTTSFQAGTYKFGVHWSAENRIAKALGVALAGTGTSSEENLCYACHSGGTVAGNDAYGAATMTIGSKNVRDAFGAANSHPVGTSGIHRSDEPSTYYQAATTNTNRHAECEDCHDPHSATYTSGRTDGRHNRQSAVNGSVAGGALAGAKGVFPTTWGANWTAPANGPSGWTSVTMAGGAGQYEAYVCFKCHTNFAGAMSGAPAAPFDGPRTNLAKEFNPNNASSHAVLGVSTADPAYTGNYQNGWGPTSKMTCTDCHNYNATTSSGPHGSANSWMLKWAYNPANEGTSGGTRFCTTECHVLGVNSGSGFNDHSSHNSRACTDCHVQIPHGWKRPHLLIFSGDLESPYTNNATPATGPIRIDPGGGGWNDQHQTTCDATGCG